MPTLRERFQDLDRARNNKLRRARAHAELVMPSLLPVSSSAFDQELPVPWSSFMSEAVNNLAARIVSVLFPLNDIPFFEIQLPLEDFDSDTQQTVRSELSKYERLIIDRFNATNFRAQLHIAMTHLLVLGDVLVYQQPDLSFRLYRLDNYVVQRYHDGTWFEIIMREAIDPDNIPPEIQALPAGPPAPGVGEMPLDPNAPDRNWMYTSIKRQEDGSFKFQREWNGIHFDQSDINISPYFPLRWRGMTGEHYGRSEAEDAFGDIAGVDGLMKGIMDGAAMNAEYRWGLDPWSMLSQDDFHDSVNGDTLLVREGELRAIQFTNHNQIGMTQQVMAHLEQRLGRRFLMNTAVQPQGERVTARQVTILAEELEAGLGGMLSISAHEIQIPAVRHTMQVLSSEGQIPPEVSAFIADEGLMNIRIRAGLEVLKREAESERLNIFMDRAQQLPEEAVRAVRWPAILRRWTTAFGLDADALIKTDETLAAEQEAEAMQQQAMMMQQQAQQAMP